MSYEPSQEYKYLLKILVLGEQGVGKTQLLNRWIHGQFAAVSPNTIGVEFATNTINTDAGRVKFQIWDTPGDLHERAMIKSYMRGASIIFIVISADTSKLQKKDQIEAWLKLIAEIDIKVSNIKIAIIETKSDLPNVVPLSIEDLSQFKGRYAFHQICSAKTGAGIDKSMLENNLKITVSQIIEPYQQIEPISANTPSPNNNMSATQQPILKLRPTYHLTEKNINALTEQQAITLLNSLRYLLDRGPVNEDKKRYDMWFGGRFLKQIGDTKIKAPEHVVKWIHEEVDITQMTETSSKIQTFATLYLAIMATALNKPFSRSASTQDFYNSLLNFIEFCVDPNNNYFVIRENIDKLPNNPLSPLNALNIIINRLKEGPLRNSTCPYNVTFFGGKKVIVGNDQVSIKTPKHIASLLNYLLYDFNSSSIEKICFALDFTIASKFSMCSSRERSTQDFYNELPGFIASTIAKIVEENSAAASPYRML